jgi:hypothetical protein
LIDLAAIREIGILCGAQVQKGARGDQRCHVVQVDGQQAPFIVDPIVKTTK